MYSSEKNPGINWKDLIIKAIFLVIFLLLLVWLFPKVPNMKPFYSNVFRENIKYMQDAAESYYTNERLPKNIGDSAEMTLQEMINKNLILPFVDEDGNECDTYSSYVQVKKNQNDYTLKVNLVCPKESNYVEKTLGCYDYCDTCKQELEYQFKKETTSDKTLYSCPNGGTLSNGTCNIYSTDSYKATATTSKGEYYCPKGGNLSGTTCYVSDTSSYTASTTTGKYYCPYGGNLSGTTCYVSDSSSYAAVVEYDCPSGGRQSGNLCIVTSTGTSTVPMSIRNYTCPDGTINTTGICKTTTTTPGTSYIKNYTCPNGTTQSSATCTVSGTAKTETKYIKSTTPKGSGYTKISEGYEYTCSNHAQCPKRVYYYNYSYKKTTYTCPKGYSGSKTCTATGKPNYAYTAGSSVTNTTTGKPNYYCAQGTQSGNMCLIKNNTSYSYAATQKTTCPYGGYRSGNRCIIDDSYTYQASKDKDTKYCPNGGYLNGDKCIVDKSYNYQASLSTGNTIYTCPNGGELKDKSCYVTKLSSSYKATVTTKKVSSVSYKWSKEESLEGWTKTGETRIAASSMAARN